MPHVKFSGTISRHHMNLENVFELNISLVAHLNQQALSQITDQIAIVAMKWTAERVRIC